MRLKTASIVVVFWALGVPLGVQEGFAEPKSEPSFKILGYQGEWTAFEVEGPEGYFSLAAPPKASQPKERKGIRLIITLRPAPFQAEMNYVVGMKLPDKAHGTLKIGKQEFPLICQGDSAWTQDPMKDKMIVDLMKKGNECTLTILREKDQPIKDTFSLKGFTKTLETAQQAQKKTKS